MGKAQRQSALRRWAEWRAGNKGAIGRKTTGHSEETRKKIASGMRRAWKQKGYRKRVTAELSKAQFARWKRHHELHGYGQSGTLNGRLQKAYGITQEQYDAMVLAQGGRCKICGRHPSGRGPSQTRLNVDHDHATGKMRGLLCCKCNMDLGWYEKARERMEQYLAEYR